MSKPVHSAQRRALQGILMHKTPKKDPHSLSYTPPTYTLPKAELDMPDLLEDWPELKQVTKHFRGD